MDIYSFRHAIEEILHFSADKSGYLSDDNEFSKKAIAYHLVSARAIVILEQLRLGKPLSENMFQTLHGVELKEENRTSEVPFAPESGCYWLKSVEPIPSMLNISIVGDILASERFDYLKWRSFDFIKHSRIRSAKKAKYWTIREIDGLHYLYIYNDNFMEGAAITAIFYNPMDAAKFPNFGKVNEEALCNPLDVNFYTDPNLREIIFKIVLQTMFAVNKEVDILENDKKDVKP